MEVTSCSTDRNHQHLGRGNDNDCSRKRKRLPSPLEPRQRSRVGSGMTSEDHSRRIEKAVHTQSPSKNAVIVDPSRTVDTGKQEDILAPPRDTVDVKREQDEHYSRKCNQAKMQSDSPYYSEYSYEEESAARSLCEQNGSVLIVMDCVGKAKGSNRSHNGPSREFYCDVQDEWRRNGLPELNFHM